MEWGGLLEWGGIPLGGIQGGGSVAAGIDGHGPRVVGRRVRLGVRWRGSVRHASRDVNDESRFAVGG